MRLRWTEAAVGDLAAIRERIAQDHPDTAPTVAKRILEAVQNLESHPRMGRPGRVAQTRELVVQGTPYIIPYRIHHEVVQLLRILHGAQRWPARF